MTDPASPDALRARLAALERAAWRVLDLLDEGALTVTDARFIDAAAEAFDALEAALTDARTA